MILPWIPVGVSVLVVWHVAGNGFYHDDFLHLFKMANGPFATAVLGSHGGHWLVGFNAIVGLLHEAFGLDAVAYFVPALVAHAVSVRLVVAIVSRTTGMPYLAAFVAGLWGLCPLLPASLGWISVHGQVYATTGVLWALYEVARADGKLTAGALVRADAALLLAAACFGVGLGTAVAFGAAVYVWTERTRLALGFAAVAVAIAVLYPLTRALYPGPASATSFDVARHLLAFPGNLLELFALGSTGFLVGPAMVGELAVLSPEQVPFVAIPIGAAVAAGLAYAAIAARPAERRRILALGVLLLGCYAPIALSRQFDLTTLMARLRYHYLALAILSIGIGWAIAATAGRHPSWTRAGRGALALWFAVGLVVHPIASPRFPAAMLASKDEQLARAQGLLRDILERSADLRVVQIQNVPYPIGNPKWEIPGGFPGLAAVFVISYPENRVGGTRVRFLVDEQEYELLSRLYPDSRLSGLIGLSGSSK